MDYYFLVSIALMIIGAAFGGIITHKKRMFRKAQEEFEQEISDALYAHEIEMSLAIEHNIDGCAHDIDQPVEGDYHPEVEYE